MACIVLGYFGLPLLGATIGVTLLLTRGRRDSTIGQLGVVVALTGVLGGCCIPVWGWSDATPRGPFVLVCWLLVGSLQLGLLIWLLVAAYGLSGNPDEPPAPPSDPSELTDDGLPPPERRQLE